MDITRFNISVYRIEHTAYSTVLNNYTDSMISLGSPSPVVPLFFIVMQCC
jgi:hypothetical protein